MTDENDHELVTASQLVRRTMGSRATWLLLAAWVAVALIFDAGDWPFPVLFLAIGVSFIVLMRSFVRRG